MLIPLPPGVSTLSGATPSHVPAMVPLLDMADHRAGATARFVLVRGREGKIGKSEVGFGGGSGTTRSVASGSASVEDHDPFACLDGLGLQGGPASGPGRDRGQDTVAYDSAGTRESSTISDPIGEGWLIGLQVGTSHRPGQSLDISYGALTNAALAVRYGFTVQGNAADVVPVKLAWVHEEHAAGAIPKLVIEGSHAWPYSSHADSEGGSGREGAPAYRCTLSCMAVPPKLLSAAYFAVFHQDVPANPSASFPLDASSLLRDAAVAAFHAACPSPAHAQQAIAWVVQQIEGMVKAIHDAQEGQTRTEDPSLLSHTNSMCSMVRDGVVDVLHATIRMVKE